MVLGGSGAVVAGGLAGACIGLLACRSDYCGVGAIVTGLIGGAVALPLGVWLTGTYLADGDGNLLGSYAGAVLGLLVTLPLHAIPNLEAGGQMAILGLNVVAPLVGAIIFYEATSHVSASAARALRVADVSLLPSVTRDRTGALAPALALSGRFH